MVPIIATYTTLVPVFWNTKVRFPAGVGDRDGRGREEGEVAGTVEVDGARVVTAAVGVLVGARVAVMVVGAFVGALLPVAVEVVGAFVGALVLVELVDGDTAVPVQAVGTPVPK